MAAAEAATKLGNMRYGAALLVGFVVAVACIWSIRVLGNGLPARFDKKNSGEKKLGSRAVFATYCLGFVWFVVSPFFGYQVTRLFVEKVLLGQ